MSAQIELLDPLCLAWHLAHALSDLNLSRHDPDNPKKKRRDWKRREGEKSSKSKVCEAKLAKKNEILNKRRQSQKQFAQLGSYASQAQRDIDNARQSFIVETFDSKEKRMMTISQISTSLKGPQMSLRTKKSKLKLKTDLKF